MDLRNCSASDLGWSADAAEQRVNTLQGLSILPESQGHNLALTVLCVPNWCPRTERHWTSVSRTPLDNLVMYSANNLVILQAENCCRFAT